MDEQTLSIIEALANLRASGGDLDEVKLAQKKVRTPEGVEKYDQPIGTPITKDMIEYAKKKAQAGSGAVKTSTTPSATPSQSSASQGASTAPKASVAGPAGTAQSLSTVSAKKETGVPGNQTSADIDNFFVSTYINNPSKASMGWVQKKDGSWYQQSYKDGVIQSETPLNDDQVNALVEMEKKGLIYTGHIADPEPETKEQKAVNKLKEAIDSGKTVDDPSVQKLIGGFQPKNVDAAPAQKESSEPKASVSSDDAKSDSSAKTVKINGKDVKVGRYSRPKGFAKAFLIVHEDGTVEYENKTGARKKISHNAFDKNQELGMTKFLTSDTGPIKKDQHFEDGKLVNDKGSEQAAPAAKVEPMKTPISEPKSAPAAEKPAQEAPKTTPGGASLKDETATKIKFVDLDEPKNEAPKPATEPKKEESESGTVKIGNLNVKPGRYSRPKGFAKAFLIVHKDGTVEYENKKGERKKIGPKSFEGHWNLGMNKFLTPNTRALKKDEVYENGKLVGGTDVPEKEESSNTPAPPSAALEAAKKAAADLKVKQDAKAAADKEAAEKQEPVKTKKMALSSAFAGTNSYDVPEDAEIYAAPDYENNPKPPVIYYKDKSDGKYVKVGVSSGIKKIQSDDVNKAMAESIEAGDVIPWKGDQKVEKKDKATKKIRLENMSGKKATFEVPAAATVYVPQKANLDANHSQAFYKNEDGTFTKVGVLTGVKKLDSNSSDVAEEFIKKGSLVPLKLDDSKAEEAFDDDSKGMINVMIGGKPAHPVPADTKIYKIGFLSEEETKAKYYKDGDDWYAVTGSSQYKANSTLSGNLNEMLGNGALVEDTESAKNGKAYVASADVPATEAEKAVESPTENSPAAMPTEVKSVKISGMDIKPGKYSIGKAFAKAFLIVHPDGTAEYMNKSGQIKKLTPAAFKKNWDAGMNKYAGPIEAATGPAQSEAKPTVVSGLKPGMYSAKQDGVAYGDASMGIMEVKEDGSAVFKQGTAEIPLTPELALDSVKYGNVMDEFGNTVVLPNSAKPKNAYIFGSTKAISLEDLAKLRDEVVTGNSALMPLKNYTGTVDTSLMLAYAKKFFPGEADTTKKIIIKAIDDILGKAENKQAEKPSTINPPTPSKALFTQNADGYFVKPDVLTDDEKQSNFAYMSTSENNAILKKISSAYGGKIISAPSKLGGYAKSDWFIAYNKGDFKLLWNIENNAGMKMHPDHPGAPENKDTHSITWAPAIPGELPAGKIPAGEWTSDPYEMESAEIDNYLIAANAAYPTHMSASNKQYWVKYHMGGDQSAVDGFSLKALKHSQTHPNSPYSSPLTWTEGVVAKKAYDAYFKQGYAADSWSFQAIKDYLKDNPSIAEGKDTSNNLYSFANAIDNHIATAKAEQAAKEAAEYAEKMKPKFTKVPGQSVSGGHHEAMVVVDQFGQKWVYKPRDDKDIFLADVEQAAHELGRSWGYKTAKSFITEFDGRKGHVQQMFDAEKDLSGVQMSTLSESQIKDVAKEHLLDWALDNDDTWGANALVITKDSVVGIDKGRAFYSIGHWKGLTADSSAHVHMPLIYTDLYKAIADKSISQEVANEAYFAVIKQARKMEKLSDAKMTEILERGFANRTNWAATGGPASKDEAIKAALERKNNLVNDMETLWDNVFKKAGYDKPEAPANVVTNGIGQDIHLGITPAALEQAKENKSYGASVFFAGPAVEDSHLLLYHTKTKTGTEILNGEMKVRENTPEFKNLEKWLKDNAVTVGDAYGFTPGNMTQSLPNEKDYYSKIIDGVKTISMHALDGQYNADKLNGMSWVKNTLQNYVNEYDSKMADSVTQAELVKQYKDPKAFLDMAHTYLGYIAKAETHKANNTKSAPGEFQPYVWTPPKEETPEPVSGKSVTVELRKASSAKAVTNGVPKLEDDGSLQHHYGYTTDGNPGSMYLVTLPTGETIEFRGNTTGTPAASKGLTRFTMPAGADEAASMERIRTQMAAMGMPLEDATEDDLELFYWRHLAGIMDDRADSKKNSSGYEQTTSTPKYKKFQEARPVEVAKMSPQEELEAWKNAFANITSREQIDEFVGEGGHLPKFNKFHPADQEKYSGQPFWERFDVTDDMWQSKQLLAGSFYVDEAAQYVADTGGMLATETRLRTLGMWQNNMSSSSDMNHGSSQFVFIRQNQEVTNSSASYNLMGVYYSPHILKRTHNYAFEGDLFGEMQSKSTQAHFDFDKLTSHNSSGNEIMVKHSVSLLDDIEMITFTSEALRNQIIKQYKDMGVTEIRGVPVEQRFVMRNKSDIMNAQKAVKEAWKK